jgi:methylamine dehydrogenase accessory protein MauD
MMLTRNAIVNIAAGVAFVRFFLAFVFVLAGITKLRNLAGFQKTIVDFGLPSRFGHPFSVAIPCFELLVAVSLITVPLARWPSVIAFLLLIVFTSAIAINLLLGRRPDCNCFGQLHSAPVSGKTLMRNGLLATCAVFLIFSSEVTSHLGAIRGTREFLRPGLLPGILAVIAICALMLQGWIILRVTRQHGRMLIRLGNIELALRSAGIPFPDIAQPKQLQVGAAAPLFELPSLSGDKISLRDLCALGRPVLLIFTDPDCSPCNALLPEIAGWEKHYESYFTIALISRGTQGENLFKGKSHRVKNILLQQDHEIATQYQLAGTPSATIVDVDGLIRSYPVFGAQSIEHLVRQIVATSSHVSAFDVSERSSSLHQHRLQVGASARRRSA